MTDRELKAVAVGIITYETLKESRTPDFDSSTNIIEAAAMLDEELFERTLEICHYADLDNLELLSEDDW